MREQHPPKMVFGAGNKEKEKRKLGALWVWTRRDWAGPKREKNKGRQVWGREGQRRAGPGLAERKKEGERREESGPTWKLESGLQEVVK